MFLDEFAGAIRPLHSIKGHFLIILKKTCKLQHKTDFVKKQFCFRKVGDILEEKKDKQYVVLDSETGEIIDRMYDGDRIVRKKQIEYYNKNAEEIEKDKVYSFGQSDKFTMLNQYAAKELSRMRITGSEFQIMFLMMANTNYKSGLITKGNNHNINEEWIAEQLGINIVTVGRCIRKFVDKGIIFKGETAFKIKYFFNPYIQYKGAWINKTLYEMFKGTVWASLVKKNK